MEGEFLRLNPCTTCRPPTACTPNVHFITRTTDLDLNKPTLQFPGRMCVPYHSFIHEYSCIGRECVCYLAVTSKAWISPKRPFNIYAM